MGAKAAFLGAFLVGVATIISACLNIKPIDSAEFWSDFVLIILEFSFISFILAIASDRSNNLLPQKQKDKDEKMDK